MAGGFSIQSGGVPKDYPGKVTTYVLITCIATAMGGLIFGYDTGISGGVTSMAPFLKRFFPTVYRKEVLDKSTNQYCKFDSFTLIMFTSSLYLAALVASFGASKVTRSLGRKGSMLLGGTIFLCGSLVNAAAQNIAMLIIGRLLLGIGVGFATQSVLLYVSEMALYKHRGLLNVLFQLSITVGILCTNVVNYFTQKMANGEGWRVSLAGAAVPALITGISVFLLANTPNSILEKGNPTKAREMLRRIRGVSDREVEAEFNDIVEATKAVKDPWSNLSKRKYWPHLIMSVLIPMFRPLKMGS